MSELTKHLIVAILKFLEDQRQNGGLSEDATESLEGKMFDKNKLYPNILSVDEYFSP